MKKLTDEEIQKLFEISSDEDLPVAESIEEDAKVYELLFQELKKEPSIHLHAHFAEMVTQKVWVEKKSYAVFNVQTLLWLSISAALILSILVVFYVYAAFVTQSLSTLLNFKWILLFAVSMILLIELGDKYLVRRKIGVR